MSHDRGCWKCGRDIYEYSSCPEGRKKCAKANVRKWPKVRVKANSRSLTDAND